MPSAPAYADLELHLIAEAPHTYRVDVRFRLALSIIDTHLIAGEAARVVINQVALDEVWPDVDAYGQRLARMLFADLRLQAAFTKARDQAEGARQPLRVCLRLDMTDVALHALRWETLHDPTGSGRLFTSERVILSRYIDSPDTGPIDLRTPRQLKVLIVVAAPTDLKKYKLASIDVTGEVKRAQTALGTLRSTVLTRDATGAPVTLTALGQALRDGVDVLYLVAHGQLMDGKPSLCLERQDETAVWADGEQLVRQIAQLARRPLLIVLASCQSARHTQDQGALAALGPRLAGHGVAAVVAMQGNVSMDTVAQLVPALFRKLRDAGQVDLAMAYARAAVVHQPDWWMPALFLRVRSGQILEQLYTPEQHLPSPFRGAVVRMIEEYEAIFGGREKELAVLNTWLDHDIRPYAFLHAPTGRGKTALLIHWVARVQQRGDWNAIFVPISLRFQTATAESVLGALATALAAFHGERERLTTYNTSPDQLRPLIADYLRRAPDDGRRLLVILDGLDEAVGWHIGRELFPWEPGSYLRIVASARQRAQMTRTDWYEQLGWRVGQTADLELAGLRREAVTDILRRMGNPLDTLAKDVDLLSEITRVSEGDPLTIRYLVEALKDGTLAPGKLVSLPPGLEAYIRVWYKELEQKSSRITAVSALLSLCAIALGPLTNNDIQRLAPEQLSQQDVLNQAVEEVGRFIIGDGSEQGGYIFSHPRLREIFAEKVRSLAERRNIRERFIADGRKLHEECVRPVPAYVRQFWITHLAEANEWDLVKQVLTEVTEQNERVEQFWSATRYTAEGSYTGYLADLDMLWRHAEECGEVATGIKCALIMASIRSLSGNLTPELLMGLITVGTMDGRWSMAAALEHVHQMPDAHRQLAAIRALITIPVTISYVQALEVTRAIVDEQSRALALSELAPHLPDALLPSALEAARAIVDEQSRALALSELAPHLPDALLSSALEAARAITNEQSRALALGQLAPHLPAPDQLVTYQAAFEAAHAIANRWSRALALGQLAPHLPAPDQPAAYQAAFEAARAIANERSRALALGQLAPHLPDTLLFSALKAARAIANERSRALALGQLAPHLPDTLLLSALKAARAIANEHGRAEALCQLAPYLPDTLLFSALKTALAIANERSRALALGQIAPYLPAPDQPAAYQAALEAALAISNKLGRALILGELTPRLPAPDQPAAYQAALEATLAIVDKRSGALALSQLAPHLPDTLLPTALKAAHAIANEQSRAEVLGKFAPHLSDALLPTALKAARTIADEQSRALALSELAPHLPDALLPSALEAARAIVDEPSRASALGQLAPHLPDALLPTAFEAARAIADEPSRAEALSQLAPHLSAADQPAAYQAALEAACAIADERSRASALGQLAPHLPLVLLPSALEAACAIIDAESRASALSQLAPHLPDALLPTVFEAARALGNGRARAGVLGQLAPRLPDALLPSALEAALTIADERSRASTLGQLAPHLPDTLLPTAFEAARAIADKWSRALILSKLAPHLSAPNQPAAYQTTFDAARVIADKRSRAEVLGQLAPHLPALDQPIAYQAALEATRAIADERNRASALGQLAPHLPLELLPNALEVVCAISDEQRRAETLSQIVPYIAAYKVPVQIWSSTLCSLATYGRSGFLTSLAALNPWLVTLTKPEERVQITQAIIAVCRCWP
ncbi:CHAT domain-containing protein [Oscillochloris sp. ZM17-4]|uniref:CHAT domain-containing protein n=1 Tax=Oscillochloris sp. ZM17-4 TaxID=2866714 RepID=UPI001C739009|nr:CHAT domain-containing protein [Oscillochloris sp. ZM17-4]MBX0328192.1 CHAT domain-containing protein [Oscillochloris sp. ZM17-4]